ncbi:hypothetical protein E2C01_068811 [Portunus trituberculatus]|uniref:Uncharacterized protein n=1 Tax=Portunus trituberculatus TaxID=210409 RepID=A0A5B7HT06_PORTR|nr:hypothetical protein [Portunus trituberculatus]
MPRLCRTLTTPDGWPGKRGRRRSHWGLFVVACVVIRCFEGSGGRQEAAPHSPYRLKWAGVGVTQSGCRYEWAGWVGTHQHSGKGEVAMGEP